MLTEQGKAFARALRDTQKPDQIAEAINADTRTAGPVPLNQLAPLLRKTGLTTVIKSVVADAGTPAPLKGGLSAFLDQLSDLRQQNLDTTDAVIAGQAAQVLAALTPIAEGAGIANVPAIVDGIYTLGGGFLYGRTDAAEVTALFAADDALAKLRAIEQRITSAFNAAMGVAQGGNLDPAAVRAAFDEAFAAGA